MKIFGIFATAALSFTLFGCADRLASEEDPGEFADESGQAQWNPVREYPAEVGYLPGRSVPNVKFMGYADYNRRDLTTYPQYLQMADFYNPDGVQYEDHPYWNGAMPKVVVLTMGATWCPPCQVEARELWPPKSQEYLPQGVQFISLLLQDNNGDPATFDELVSWAAEYMVSWDNIDEPGTFYTGQRYVLGLDPTETLLSMFQPLFPGNMIIRTSDMKIMYRAAGTAVDFPTDPNNPDPVQDFWDVLDGVLDGTITEPILEQL